MVREHFHHCDIIDECLQNLEFDEHLAVGLSRLHAENNPVISKTQLYCFARENNIYSYSVAMPMKIDFHLRPIINLIIRQLFEFGLIERWDKLSQAIATSSVKVKVDTEGSGNLVVLTVPHIMGAVLILISGMALAFLLFLIERIAQMRVKKRNCFRFWKRLDHLLDPKIEEKTNKPPTDKSISLEPTPSM